MSEPLVGIILAHAEVAEALVSAVRAIAGGDHGLVPVSNAGCDRAAIQERLVAAVGGRPAVIFTDLPGGSCAVGAGGFARLRPDVRVVTGVNLPMLLDFAFHRERSAEEAAVRAVATGRAAVGGGGAGQ
jgi:mannose/fructose-specific phosphotransferase system component IIA